MVFRSANVFDNTDMNDVLSGGFKCSFYTPYLDDCKKKTVVKMEDKRVFTLYSYQIDKYFTPGRRIPGHLDFSCFFYVVVFWNKIICSIFCNLMKLVVSNSLPHIISITQSWKRS